ncbi:uncharacterized protein LOC102699804 [Oryza brachyantha]|uniref:Uncharacterized protein n=1 Tax=Oryza brachyantha TaxID=4533 RepID=J3MUH8_ORYBR|nr:uncharacterized protein LOC102699804 [Oryza brachyantha]
MVVLMEECPGGVALKRKGAEEPELFLCPGDVDGGFPLACRATKMRRLVRDDAPAAAAADDVAMGEAASTAEAAGGEGAMMVYEPADSAGGVGLLGQLRRLQPWTTSLRAGAGWIRDMLREADSRTVRQLLSGVQEDSAGMALVPCGSSPAPIAAGPSMAEDTAEAAEEDSEGSVAAMEIEEEEGVRLAQTLGGAGAGCGEGYLFRRWPRHCLAQPQLPVIGQASPAMWSW